MFASRTPTIYSLNQLEADECKQQASKSSKDAIADIPGAMVNTLLFPMRKEYNAKRIRSFGELQDAALVPDATAGSSDASDDDSTISTISDDLREAMLVPVRSLASEVLLGEWEDRFERDLFRYDVTACPSKVVPGVYGFVAQCNEGRASKKRPTEFTIDKVEQPFDDARFNFTKAAQEEALFAFQPARDGRADYLPRSASASPNLVLINVSPIEYGHVLLVPRVLDRLNQVVDQSSMLLALQFVNEVDDPYFRVGFNSLGAYGTINHLHFQAYFLEAPYPIERVPCASLPRKSMPSSFRGVKITQLRPNAYPVRALVFESSTSLANLAMAVGRACANLVAANVPHNLLISDKGARVFVIPNAFSERKAKGEIPEAFLASQVDPACWEISGHLVLKRQQDYDAVDHVFCWELLSYASFDEERFASIASIALRDL